MKDNIVKKSKDSSIADKFLNFIEKGGNKLPHPVTLFVIIAFLVVIFSAILSAAGTSVELARMDGATGTVDKVQVFANNLLSEEGVRFMFEGAVSNFTGFAPVGVVLVTMLGIAVAEGTGLITACLRKLMINTPKNTVTIMAILMGAMSNIASDSGYVVVVPLGALMFLSMGRNPIAGIAAAFFGVAGGFSANLLIGSIDPLLAGFSTIGARVLQNDYFVSPLANYYFMAASTLLITVLGIFVNNKIVEPRLGEYTGTESASFEKLSEDENRGLKYSLIALIITVATIILLVAPKNGLLRNPVDGQIFGDSPFMNSIVIIVGLVFFLPGLFYGIGAKTIKNDKELVEIVSNIMGSMGGYLVLTFVASQFVAYFRYSNIGLIMAVNGAEMLKAINLSGVGLLIIFVFITAIMNLFIGSAVTKWSIMAPVFVPMFMMLGLSPESTQLAFRVGDSSTNIISPLMPFFAIVLNIAEKYDKKIGMGTLISVMMPYSFTLLIAWTIFMVVWLLLGIPMGPGVSLFLP